MAEDIYENLRAQALSANELGLVTRSTEHPDVTGLVVDIPAQEGFSTLVALQDGTTSMYTSTGGGVIGAGEHAEVADLTSALLAEVQRQLEVFGVESTTEHPSPEYVRFFVLTNGDQRVADIPLQNFWEPTPTAAPELVAAVQHLLTRVREHSESH